MAEPTHGTVAVEGADLYYKVKGRGTPILIIQGGISDGDATSDLAGHLSDEYQVITYDRRGLSRSRVTGSVPVSMRRHAQDAAALAAAAAEQPIHVIGASIGALIGLHLVVDYPHLVATVLAHEPPMSKVVLDERQEAALDTVAEIARTDTRGAIRRMASLGGDQPAAEAGSRVPPPAGDIDKNLQWFFSHDFPAVRESSMDAEQLRSAFAVSRIVLSGGESFPGRWEYRCAEQLATSTGCEFIQMPGGHNGLISHPRATADALRRLLVKETLT